MECRRLTGADAEAWRDLRLDGLRRYPGAFLYTEAESARTPLENIVALLDAGATFGVWRDEQLIGIASLIQETANRARHRASIGAFYVVPEAQGSGAADALLSAVTDFAQASGIWQLELYVASNNERGIAFYARHGFEELGRLPNAIILPDGPIEDLFCVCILDH